MKSFKIPVAARVFTRYVCGCLALMLMLLYPLSAAAADKVRLQLKWQHQFQFAGYYAALAQGYYQAAGLEVEIIPCRPDEDAVQKVLQGKADFGVGSTELLLLREQGAPLVVLAVIFQHSPLVFMTLKRSGLQSIHDLVGRRIVIEPGSSELYAYLREEGISADKFTLLPHGFDAKDLLAGNVDALSAYVTDEPFEIKQAGQEYVLYSPRAAGIDFYGDNLFTTESLLKLKPKMVKAFRDASLKGWEYAMQHPEELVQLIYSRYSQRHSIEHLRFEADQMAPLLQASLVEIGHMNLGRWQHIAKTYTKLGMLKPDFNFTGFLYDPNPPPRDLRWLYALIGAGALVIVIVSALTVYIYRTNVRLKQEAANRKQAEEAIRESEKKYRLVVDNMTDVITVMDMNLRFTYVSPSIMRLRGYTPEEAMAQTLEQMMTPESQQIVVKAFEEEMALETSGSADPGRSRILELEEYRKDGSIVWSEDHLSFVRDEAQKAVGIISLTRDITERKRAEAVLRESEERYRSLFENANEAIFVAQDGRLVFLNPMTSRLIGYSSEELMGRSFLDFIHPDDQNMVIENYLKRLKGEDFQTRYTFRYLAKNGAIRWMEIGAVLIKWDGRPATLNFCTDITEQKHAAEKIRQLAYHDSLTGLPNRKLFSDRLGIALAQARRNQKDVAVTMLDLDHFKDVNDTLGHDVGDLLLKSAAERLSAALRKGDTVARFGGDEFVLILPDLKGTEDAVQVAQKIVESFRKPFLIDTHQLIVTTSIGITVCPNDGTDENMLLKNADIAMYQAKQAGRDRYQIYKEG